MPLGESLEEGVKKKERSIKTISLTEQREVQRAEAGTDSAIAQN